MSLFERLLRLCVLGAAALAFCAPAEVWRQQAAAGPASAAARVCDLNRLEVLRADTPNTTLTGIGSGRDYRVAIYGVGGCDERCCS